MSNNTVINHDTYVEITNGLFFVNAVISGVSTDDPEEFTFRSQGIQIVLRQDEEPERRENERPNRFHNMSEQEILNYLDQISQEE